jgi:intein/homing endonuclease
MDFMCPTGFGTVAHNVLDRLTPWFRRVGIKVDVAALNYWDKTTEEYNDCITVVNPKLFARNMDDSYFRDGVLKMLQIEDYDLMWAMNDVPVLGAMSPILKQLRAQKKFQNRQDFKMLLYTPIDSVPFQRYFKDLDTWDEVVTYTKYGKKEAENAFEKVNKRKIKFGVIAHGVDKVNFRKLETPKSELRKKYDLPQDAFIFGHINKNQPRKDIGTTLIAYSFFKKAYPELNSALYLHCYHSDKTGIKIHIACERLGLIVGKDVLLPMEEKYNNNKYTSKEINEVYNCFDAFVTTTMAEGWGLCLHPKSYIETDDGVKFLNEITIGDNVLTHNGEFRKVLDTTSRIVDSYYSIKTDYSNLDVKVTSEHPFLVKKGDSTSWVNVKDIKVGDYVALGKPNIMKMSFDRIDLLNFIDKEKFQYDENFIWCKLGYSPISKDWSISSIQKRYNVSKHSVETAISLLIKGKKTTNLSIIELSENLIKDGFIKNEPIKVNRFINITDELMEVFGWYIAEGSNSKGSRIEFDLNKSLLQTKAQFIKNICDNIFGINSMIEVNGNNKCRVRCNSQVISHFFAALFGVHAKNKKIPSILYNHKKIKYLIRGYFQGDGYIRASKNTISFSTISQSLAFQIRSILLSFNIMTSINFNEKRNIFNVSVTRDSLDNFNNKIFEDDLLLMRNTIKNEVKFRKHKPKFIEDYCYYFVKVNKIEFIEQHQEMLDLCIDESHSFVANGIVCHNTITEAMAVKLPIICPIHTSISEITNDGKLVYELDDLWEHLQIEDAENIRFKSNPMQVAQKMAQVYNDVTSGSFKPNYEEKMAEYEWDKIADQWKIIIKRMLQI